jgi:hypothetical protein
MLNESGSLWPKQTELSSISRPEVAIAPISLDGTTPFGFISHVQSRTSVNIANAQLVACHNTDTLDVLFAAQEILYSVRTQESGASCESARPPSGIRNLMNANLYRRTQA